MVNIKLTPPASPPVLVNAVTIPAFYMKGEIMNWREEAAPTHRCKECGALWRFWRKEETGAQSDSWNLRSSVCGKCCDMAPMGEQIEFLTLGEIEKYLAARLAVDAMTQYVLGPKDIDDVH